MRIIKTGGVRLATESYGRPGDPAVVLVMGATASMLGWPAAFCTGLAARGLQVIRFDHRDTGASTTLARANGEALAAGIAGAEVVIVPGMGHELVVPHVEQIAERVGAFLTLRNR